MASDQILSQFPIQVSQKVDARQANFYVWIFMHCRLDMKLMHNFYRQIRIHFYV
jgi:hypothetical protein